MTAKYQKALKNLAFLKSGVLFNSCSTCGKVRETVKFEDLPEASQGGFTELLKQEPYTRGATFLNCRECESYSILSSPYL